MIAGYINHLPETNGSYGNQNGILSWVLAEVVLNEELTSVFSNDAQLKERFVLAASGENGPKPEAMSLN